MLAACDFTNTNLRGADLSRSDRREANFSGAILDDARFDAATVGTLPETGMETVFPDGFLPNRGKDVARATMPRRWSAPGQIILAAGVTSQANGVYQLAPMIAETPAVAVTAVEVVL